LIEIFGDGENNQIGIWLEVSPDTTIPPELTSLAFIRARIINQKGQYLLEVTTTAITLQRQFYHFAVAVAERVVVENRPAIEAVSLELRCFTDLLEEKSILGIERQIGVIGELIFLERLIVRDGVGALNSWLGPAGEPHDFRLHSHEFEVKTTVSPHRIHTIHGMEQLVPSKGCLLYLISVMLGPSGASDGFSLSSKIEQITRQLASSAAHLSRFRTALVTCGYREADSGQYIRRFVLRRPMGLVPVDIKFPAITRQSIQKMLGPLATRVEALQYDVNVEGLEHEDGTVEFDAAITG
jgi:hypothetical protein